jgi:L-histidine Nalpha-methyltransferase
MSGAHVFVDRSQFPENVRRDLIQSLRGGAINHKFHYESYKQAAKWLALHEAYSPARQDASCLRIYDDAFAVTAQQRDAARVHLVGLGVGGGQKEARLAESLRARSTQVVATVSDVSLPLVLVAREALLGTVDSCHAAVFDLATAENLSEIVDANDPSLPRIVTCFGIIPNFEPELLAERLAELLRSDDLLLFSANLAPGSDYAAGVDAILPQYNNALTRDWLMTLLLDLGFNADHGDLRFSIEANVEQLRRITAYFEFRRPCEIRVLGERLTFAAGQRLRVFFSYRHTVSSVTALIAKHGIEVAQHWLNDSGEEGVFLCRKR